MKYTFTYSLTSQAMIKADSVDEAKSLLEDWLRDNNVNLKQANLQILNTKEEKGDDSDEEDLD
jgi:hypothetical protein